MFFISQFQKKSALLLSIHFCPCPRKMKTNSCEMSQIPGSDKGLLRIVNSISNAVGFFYPRYEHQLFPQKKPFLVDILESLHLLINSSSRSIPNDSNVAVECYILTTLVLLIVNIFFQKKPR